MAPRREQFVNVKNLTVVALPALLTLVVSAVTLVAGPPGMADADFNTWLADYNAAVAAEAKETKKPVTDARRAELQAEAMSKIELSNLLPAQITTLLAMDFVDPSDPATKRELLQRLAKYRSDRNADGAAAQAAFAMVSADTSSATQAFQRALIHPNITEAIRDGKAPGFLTTLRDSTDERDRKRLGDRIGTLSDACVASMSPEVLHEFEALHEVAKDALDEDDLKDLRAAMLQAASAVSMREDLNDALGPDAAEFVSTVMQSLAAYSTVAEGVEAPEIDFLWVSDGDFTKLSDLRGQVVVLDFWATWCGPCIASFPKIREMQKRYEGFPVRIVGVTSPQGGVRTPAGPNYARDFDHEVEMTQQFAAERGLTWTYAFSVERVFNPDYAVNGIPHVAIISPDGRLVHNDLHPARTQDIMANIDALLEEAGLPKP
jgi:thiol-disulfide isomerase/thioredoxin